MGEVFAEKKKAEITADFKLGSKTYTAKYQSMPDIKEVGTPPKTKKLERIDAFFVKLAKDNGVSVYQEDGTKIEYPSDKMLAKAGKALYGKAMTKMALESTIETQKKIFKIPKKV